MTYSKVKPLRIRPKSAAVILEADVQLNITSQQFEK